MLSQALQERTCCRNVSRRVGIQDDHIVEIGRHLFQALDKFVDTLTNHPGEALLPWGITSRS